MSKSNSGWVRRQTAVLLSATLALSPVMAVPALATETADDAPLEQTQGTENVDTGQSAEKDEAVEKDVEPEGTADSTDSAEANADPAPAAKDSVPASNDAAPQADGGATIVSADGQISTDFADAKEAAKKLQDGETLVLNENYTGEWGLSVAAANVTIDLNGHNVTSTKDTSSTSNGYAINIKKPSSGATTHTVTIKNSSQDQAVLSSSVYQIVATSGNSNATLTVALEGNIVFESTSGSNALGISLGTGSRMADSDTARAAVPNGGFLSKSPEGSAYVYGTFANAAKNADGGTVTLLHDYTGSDSIKSGSSDAVLDLDGHTYTYTGEQTIAEVNYDSASLSVSNGTLMGTNDSSDGVQMLYSGSSLVLDGVSIEVPGSCYGIVTNGTKTDNSITLRNSTLNVPAGYGIYFPSTGLVTIDNSTITAEFSGIQMCAGSLVVKGDGTSITVTGEPQEKTGNDGVIADGAAISVVKRDGYQDLGSVSITGGTFTSASGESAVKAYSFNNTDKKENTWDGAGDVVAVSGGSFSSEVPADLCADGFSPEKDEDGNYTVAPSESTIATVTNADGSLVGAYESLQDAASAVPDGGTVTLTEDAAGNGVKVSEGTNFTLDLGGFTYTVDGDTVGSPGTETNGFQLLQNSDIVIKNGTITSNKAKILIQNYSNLTLEDVTLDGGTDTQYTLSNNNGEVHIGKGTNIYAGEALPRVAFDVCRFSSYPSVHVTVDEGAGRIVGAIELSASDNSAEDGFSLTINGGDLSGAELSVAEGGGLAEVEKTHAVSLLAPEGYQWIDGTLKEVGSPSDPDTTTVASITDASGNVTYFSTLANAISAAGEGQTVALLGDVTESVTVPNGKNLTLDLAGHTLTNTADEHTVTVENGGTLTVTDSSDGKIGVIDNVSHGKGALVNYGTAIVEGGTFTRSAEASTSPTNSGGNSWYVIDNQGTLTFNGGNVVNEGYFSSLVRNAAGTLTINGGTFKNHFIAVKNEDATLYVKGGTITSDEQSLQNWGKATLSGGTLNGRVAAWDQDDDLHSLTTIEGDVTINGDVQAINYLNAEEGPEVIITGGTVTGKVQKATHDGSTGTKPADPTSDTSVITISGGKFETAPDEELIVPGSGLTQNSDGSFGIHEHIGTAVAAKDPTCTEAGNKAYWECSECHELFLDEAMTKPTTREDVTIAATDHQHVTHVEAKDATETEAGNLEYWHCADCDRYFSDAALSQETTLAELTIPAKGQEPAETHTVTFMWTLSTKVVYNEIADGSILNPPTDAPELDGWTFTGRWFTDAACTEEFDFKNTPVTGDLTLYAGWLKDATEDPTKPETPKDEDAEKDDGLAQTGDATAVAPLVASAVAGVSALVAGAVTLRKRK